MDNWNEHDPAWLDILLIILPLFSFCELIMAMEYTREALSGKFPMPWLFIHWTFVLIPILIGLRQENVFAGIVLYCIMSPFLAIMLWVHKRMVRKWGQSNSQSKI